MGVEYEASDAFSALLRGNYVGTSYVLNEKYKVPSYFTMDLGVKYKTKMNSTPVTLNAMCYNVFNKKLLERIRKCFASWWSQNFYGFGRV